MPITRVIRTVEVPASKLHPNPRNPRFESGDVTDMVESIKQFGLLQSVLVRDAPQFGPDDFELLGGQRRWTACRLIDPEYPIDCRVLAIPDDMPRDELTIVVALHENDRRKELTPMERARAYGRLREFGRTQKQIAELLGVKDHTISRYLSLLELAPQAQKRVENRQLSVEDATAIIAKHRAKVRESKGQLPTSVGWEPDHFTEKHFLARKAKKTCDVREHNNRRRRGGACDQCWETVIRQDEATVQQAAWREQGHDIPFLSPEMAAVGNRLGHGSNGKS